MPTIIPTIYWVPIVSLLDIVAVALYILPLILPTTLWREVIIVSFYRRRNWGFKEIMSFSPGQRASVTKLRSKSETMWFQSGTITSILSLARLCKCRFPMHSLQVSQEHHDITKTKIPDKHAPLCTCVHMHLCERRQPILGSLITLIL